MKAPKVGPCRGIWLQRGPSVGQIFGQVLPYGVFSVEQLVHLLIKRFSKGNGKQCSAEPQSLASFSISMAF
jgi:hypothetical protein